MGPRVFYLEDEPFLAQVVVESLQKNGYEVHHVSTGAHAVEECLRIEPDLCLLDVMVPVVDGFQIGKDIREKVAELPIIFLTAKVQSSDVVEGFNSGGTDYLRKPFSMEELLVRMEHHLKWKPETGNKVEAIKLGAFDFDKYKQELKFKGEATRLSYRESQLLDFLVQSREGIAERKDILMNLWGDDSYFNSRNLDVYIKKLRDRLKKDPDVEIITLKGVGYRVVVK